MLRISFAWVGLAILLWIGYQYGIGALVVTFLFGVAADIVHWGK